MMDFYEVLANVIEILQREGRTSYRALKRHFDLDDGYLEDLKEELLYAHPVVDDEGRGLKWTGYTDPIPNPDLSMHQEEAEESRFYTALKRCHCISPARRTRHLSRTQTRLWP